MILIFDILDHGFWLRCGANNPTLLFGNDTFNFLGLATIRGTRPLFAGNPLTLLQVISKYCNELHFSLFL